MPAVRSYGINVSEGGMAVSTPVPLKPGEQIKVQFILPGQDVPYLGKATICWQKTGCAGVRFDSLPLGQKSDLQVWLARKLEEQLPGSVTETFKNTEDRSIPSNLKSGELANRGKIRLHKNAPPTKAFEHKAKP